MIEAVAVAYAGAGILLALHVLGGIRTKRFDPFFAVFAISALVYVEIAPSLVVLTNGLGDYRGSEFVGLFPAAPTTLAYITAMTLAWVLFFVPLFWFYRVPLISKSRFNRKPAPPTRLHISGAHWQLACVVTAGSGLVFLEQVATHNLLFSRLGSSAAIEQLTSLSTFTYTVVRLYSLGAFFFVGILMIIIMRAETKQQRQWGQASLLIVSATFLLRAAVNSQLEGALFVLVLAGWYIVLSDRLPRRGWWKRYLKAALAILLLSQISLNARSYFGAQVEHTATNPFGIISPFHASGLHRLDCIDLISRLEEPINQSGPALGSAWTATPWLVERYINRGGYRGFVETGDTTAKQYLMTRYIGVFSSDFYSCSLTDLYGNFSYGGFLIGGIVFGLGFQFVRRRIQDIEGSSTIALLVVCLIVSSWIEFEIEGQQLLFGWITQVPILAFFMTFRPFRQWRIPVDEDSLADQAGISRLSSPR